MANVTGQISLPRLTQATIYDNSSIQMKALLGSKCMGGDRRRFRRTNRYHGLYDDSNQGIKRDAIKG